MTNLLTEWVKTKKLKDAQVRVGNVVFHIPLDGRNYLLFKCQRCGRCCKGQLYNALMLTLGDVQRLAKLSKCGMTPSQFIDKMCVFASITEPKEVTIPFYGPITATYSACFLKRFKEETEETAMKPHPCEYNNDKNLCDIYEARPITCQKFPYTTFHANGLTHVTYVNVPFSDCPGYYARPCINRKKLAKLALLMEKGDLEIKQSIIDRMIIITDLLDTNK